MLTLFGFNLFGVWGIVDALVREVDLETSPARVSAYQDHSNVVQASRHAMLHYARPDVSSVVVLTD